MSNKIDHSNEVIYIGYRDKSHSSAGGYDKITNYPNSQILFDSQVPFGFIPLGTFGKFINIFFLNLLSRFKIYKFPVIHYFYGDTLSWPFLKHKKHRSVATIHLNIEQRKNKKWFIKILKSLDGIIVLSTNQKKLLYEKYGLESTFIPHGFNRPFFNKLDTTIDKKQLNICVLGQQYRDFSTLEYSIRLCEVYRKDIIFHLIGQPMHFKNNIKSYSNVKIYPRLDNDTYFSIISDCDYSFLPLTFATANNSLLEAQFLGIKSILPNMTGIEDYAAPSPLNIFYSNKSDLHRIFSTLSKSEYSEEIIKYVEKFEWKNIYIKLKDFYKSVCNKNLEK